MNLVAIDEEQVAVYFYSGFDAQRVATKGTILAESPRQARDRLRSQGVIVEAISEQASSAGTLRPWLDLGNRRARKQWGLGAHELSMLLSAGVTLTDALETIAGQHRGPLRSAMLRLKENIEAGSSLADAMSGQPEIFDPASVRLVEVGENAGTLEQVLAEIAEFKLQLAGFQDKVATALMYPVFLACFGTAAMIFLMTWVLPPLLESLEETLEVLPWPTRVAKNLSDLLVEYGVWLVVSVGILVVGGWVWLCSDHGRAFADRTMLKIPVLGPLILKQSISRAAMIVALLTRGGVLLTTAVNLAAKSTGNAVIKRALFQAETDMIAGESLATSLERSGCFPPLAVRFFSVGQDSGKLDEMLQRLARDYNVQVGTATARLTALVEPVLILILAAAVGFLLLATILPILEAGNVS